MNMGNFWMGGVISFVLNNIKDLSITKIGLSLGAIFNKQRLVNAALAQPAQAVLETIKQSSCVYMQAG
jgi:hypothetical protein